LLPQPPPRRSVKVIWRPDQKRFVWPFLINCNITGGFIYATQVYYSEPGCTGTADGEATFGGENLCQPLLTVLGGVHSVKTGSVTDAGCEGKYSSFQYWTWMIDG
jgi:hypothetical protein